MVEHTNGTGRATGTQVVSWVAIAMSLGAAFWTVANPRDDIKQMEARLESRVRQTEERLQTQLDRSLPRSVHEESILRLDRDISHERDEVMRLRDRTIMRDELAKFELNNTSRMEGQANRILSLENELHGSSNIGKAIDRIQDHLNEIDRRILGVVTKPTQ